MNMQNYTLILFFEYFAWCYDESKNVYPQLIEWNSDIRVEVDFPPYSKDAIAGHSICRFFHKDHQIFWFNFNFNKTNISQPETDDIINTIHLSLADLREAKINQILGN